MPEGVADNQGATVNQGAGDGVGSGAPQTGSTGQPADWFSQIPQEYGSEKFIQNFKGKQFGDFVKSAVEAHKMVGGSIRLPKPDAPQEERDKFYGDIFNKLGRPESPDKYDVSLPERLPKEIELSEEHTKQFKETAHKLGLTQAQMKGVFEWYGNYLQGMVPDHETIKAQSYEALKKAFGGSEQAAKKQLGIAQRILLQDGDKELVDLVEQTGIGNHPSFIKLLSKYGSLAAEKGIISGDVQGVMNKDQVSQEISSMRNDPQGAYLNEKHPEHDKAVQRMNELYRLRNAL